ncbi:MAG: TIGR03915 family putative DNA repair protein, partial [Betaproteobacteria bacterium]
MRHIALAHATDFDGWRAAARALLASDIAPESVEWTAGSDAPGMFAGEPPIAAPAAAAQAPAFKVPRAFLALCATVILHHDPERFALLYRLLWLLRDERALLSVAVDPDVALAEAMVKGVHRDMHKMKAFVRFREIEADGPLYIAWFEPAHHIVAATAPFFARRFATRRWSILTPELSVHWDGEHLTFGPGARREDAPDADKLEALWRTYYASIFNPARLKVSAMQAEMPKKYWRNLPEATLITPLIAAAQQRTQQMLDDATTVPRKTAMLRAAAKMPLPPKRSAPEGSLEEAREAAAECRDCPLWKAATQTVFGEGSSRAAIMVVGEQPGDKEDLEGRPFVGPAGKMFDRALQEVGIERSELYV